MDPRPLVSLCGHTGEKLYRLFALYKITEPQQPHYLQVTFNGIIDKHVEHLVEILRSTECAPIMHVINHDTGRDVRMHAQALARWRLTEDRYPLSPWMVCMNDDVHHITKRNPKQSWFGQAEVILSGGDFDLLGFQPNLASMTTMNYLIGCNQRDRGNIERFGQAFRFIRTHAFACRLDWFDKAWKDAKEVAQRFEKDNLKNSRFALVNDYTDIMDGNTVPHEEAIREWQAMEKHAGRM